VQHSRGQSSRAGDLERRRIPELEVAVELSADLKPVNPFDFTLDGFAEQTPFAYGASRRPLAVPRMRRRFFRPVASSSSSSSRRCRGRARPLPLVTEINRASPRSQSATSRATGGCLHPRGNACEGRGSCRDSAVLLVAALRCAGSLPVS